MKRLMIIAMLLVGLAGMNLYAAPTCVRTNVALAIGTECELGDKLFSFIASSGNLGATATVSFWLNDSTMPVEYTVNVNTDTGWGSVVGGYWLQYSVQVIGPSWQIVGAYLDSNTAGTTLATKALAADGLGGITLTSINGGTDIVWFSPVRYLTVTDSWNASGGGVVWGVSNTFYQVVPEPASLALLGAGLLAMGLLRRRKK